MVSYDTFYSNNPDGLYSGGRHQRASLFTNNFCKNIKTFLEDIEPWGRGVLKYLQFNFFIRIPKNIEVSYLKWISDDFCLSANLIQNILGRV